MIPVTDTPRARAFPYVNVALIVANIAVFLYELTLNERDINRFFIDHGVVPVRLIHWLHNASGLGEPLTVITSAFIHGGWLHIGGNMLYLWVFGDNVEDALGHVRYLLFYLLAAAGAAALQVAMDQDGAIPMVGASGAIAGVLGAYLVLYPRATVNAIIPPFIFFIIPVPAVILIGLWFLLQLVTGVAALGSATGVDQGTAVWAHVGGFAVGFGLLLVLRPFLARRSVPVRR